MEAPSYTDTILLQANRKSSAEYLSGNNESKSSWTNDLGSGIKLDIGDTISVHSAYISEIGNEDATIEIKGRNAINNIGEKQTYTTKNVILTKTEGQPNNGSATYLLETTEGNYGWDYTEEENTHTIRDDTLYLTHSYYKCAQGDNYISLPRAWGADDRRGWWDGAHDWSASNTSLTGAVHSPNPYRLGTDYSFIRTFGNPDNGYGYETTESIIGEDRTEISNDGRRYTLFVRKSFKNYVPKGEKTGFYLQGQRDPALLDFIWYRKTVKYEVTKGFNSPANVATQITNKMNDIDEIQNISLGEDNDPTTNTRKDGQIKQNNLNLQAQSNTFETFPCSNAWFIRNAGELWFKNTYNDNLKIPYAFGGAGNALVFPGENLSAVVQEVNGTFEGKFYVTGQQFADGNIRVGWKFKESRRSDTNAVMTIFNPYKGAEICGIRDNKVAGERGTYCKMNKHTTNTTNYLVPDPGHPHVIYWTLTNEELPAYYESCYSTIGYLRPEIQEYGRALMDNGNNEINDNKTIDNSYVTYTMLYPMDAPHINEPSTILTGIPWTETNLLKLKNLFEAQGLYPELFNWDGMTASQQELINVTEETKDNVSVNTMRFLHMNDNTQSTTVGENKGINGSLTETTLGEYIPVNNVTDLQKGMRLYFSDADTDETPLYPRETYIISIDSTNNRVYISNPHNDIPYLTDGTQFVYFAKKGLGGDRYTNDSDVVTNNHTAGAVFFDYNPARKDIREGEGGDTDVYNSLTYGFAKKYTLFNEDYIGLSVLKYQDGTLPQEWYDEQVPPQINSRCIGFDRHFNAYGTCAILLTNGYASLWGAPYSASGIDYNNATNSWGKTTTEMANGSSKPYPDLPKTYKVVTNQPNWDGWFFHNASATEKYGPNPDTPTTARIFNEIYCGANQPSLSFSGDSSRFAFQNLHTAELKGTNAEEILGTEDVAGANATCYKINKRLSRLNYSPNFIPYNNVFKIYEASSYSASTTIAEKDNNITPYAIMDAQSGIFIEDYGCDEANWSQSLWELMGFTYSQFHNRGSRLQRFNNTGLKTSTPTTNALIKTEDLQTFVKSGESGLSVYNTLEVNYPFWRYDSVNGSGADHWRPYVSLGNEAFPGFQSYPAVTAVGAISTSIIADNLPRKMLSPIYLIKSDILNPQYIGGREGTTTLPIIGVVDKSSGYGDFYTGATNSTIFQNTIPRTIQNIKTSIVDADGSESRVDDSCCVIYKVTKQIRNNSVVLQNILNPPKK